jgi:GNAT superfamily N-acetyltransferase
MAEVALTVRDDFQGEGIGSALALQLVNEARKKGLTTLRAETLYHNQPMRRIWPKLGLPYSFQASYDVTIMLALLNP